MRKLLIPVIAAIIVAAFYIISGARPAPKQTKGYGAAEALGSDDDADARYTYEWGLLHDPATGKIPDHMRAKELAFVATLPNDANIDAAKTSSVTPAWQARGPWNVGGRTRALGIDVSNENNILAGSCSGGMWRSANKGASWTPVIPNTQLKSVSGIAQDTRSGHTNTWYYITGEAYGASASATGAYFQGNGVYKSTDSGKTWTALASTLGASSTSFSTWSEVTWDIATNPASDTSDVVYVAAYGGIYKTTDGGTTWVLSLGSFGGSDSYFTDVAVSKSGIIYATLSSSVGDTYTGTHKGIYRSTDGVTFTNISPDFFPDSTNRIKIGISPSDENQVYFIANTPNRGLPDTNFMGTVEWNSLWRYTYQSGDGSGTGGVWQDRSANLPSAGGMFDKFTCQGSYDLVVKVKPDDTNVVFIGGTNLYRSTSGFANNTQTTYLGGYQQGATLPVVNDFLNHHPDQHDLAFFPSNPNEMISSNDGGLFYCNDNTAASALWSSLNNGYLTTMFYTCAIDHATTSDYLIGGAQDNGSWFTNSTSLIQPWVTPRGGDGSFCYIADNSSAYYFSIQSGKMMRARLDNSGNVLQFARIDPIGGRGYQFVNPFTIDPNNNNIMYLAAGKFLWRNNDLSGIPYASNWDTISTNWFKFNDSSKTNVLDTSITAVSVSHIPANRVYYGTNYKRVFRMDNANTDTAKAREITSNTLFPGGGNVSCIAVDPANADNVMVVFSNYSVYSIFYSSDGGTTWAKAGGNLEGTNAPSIRWATIIPVSNGYVYLVGTSTGLFATTQLSGTSTVWVQQGTNTIGNAVVDYIDYRSTDGLVVIATHANGLYSSHILQTTDVKTIKQVAAADPGFNLTIYPNPVKEVATLQFYLKERSIVSLTIADELGRPVKTIADETMDAGEHKFPYSSGNLPAGIYYCTLRSENYSETKRLLKQ